MVLHVVERQRCGVVFMPGSRMAGVVIVYERDYLFIVCRCFWVLCLWFCVRLFCFVEWFVLLIYVLLNGLFC